MNLTKIFASAITLSIVLILVVQAALTVSVGATPGQKDDHKVVICHATNSHSNPYTVNDVDKSSVDEPKNQYLNGHGNHAGPVWYDGIADHSWGDIIPPFTNDAGTSFTGQNWTAAGQKIHRDGCNIVPETPGNPGTPGGNGGGNVLGASTGGKGGELAKTGLPVLANIFVGSAVLGTAAYVVRRGRPASN